VLLDLRTRVRLVREATASIERVSVDTFSAAGSHRLLPLDRRDGDRGGLRAVTDFEFEFQIRGWPTWTWRRGIETVFLLTDPRNISSRAAVKEIASNGGDETRYRATIGWRRSTRCTRRRADATRCRGSSRT
jgi:pantetheine-phosphate adenylyltransferase